jgi:hypothetical protein
LADKKFIVEKIKSGTIGLLEPVSLLQDIVKTLVGEENLKTKNNGRKKTKDYFVRAKESICNAQGSSGKD